MAEFNSVEILNGESGEISNAPSKNAIVNKSRAFIDLLTEPLMGDVIHLVDMSSSAYISDIKTFNQDLDTGAGGVVFDLGIYASIDFRDSTGTLILKNSVLNVNAFFDNSTDFRINKASDPAFLRFKNTNSTDSIGGYDKALWQLAGLSLDPFVDLRISATITEPFTTFVPGKILMYFEWEGKS